jgi:hypothetical protein
MGSRVSSLEVFCSRLSTSVSFSPPRPWPASVSQPGLLCGVSLLQDPFLSVPIRYVRVRHVDPGHLPSQCRHVVWLLASRLNLQDKIRLCSESNPKTQPCSNCLLCLVSCYVSQFLFFPSILSSFGICVSICSFFFAVRGERREANDNPVLQLTGGWRYVVSMFCCV